MAYVSLFRKYRPQTFEDVVGQEHVTTTLQNAIRRGRVASGYLFCGTRGTAKTTCARILAKALNCIGADGQRTDPSAEPCGVCIPCRGIAASSFVDVLEMDAASHGKVDDVRDLVASIKFPPMEGRYKVYIIDEAHQLSRDAMDAFLKTLEEPPDRVIFILATTELDKLPITIASRCQVFEFKRGSVAQIAARLTDVLQAEGVTAQPAAITMVARAADGSYRDSLSLLEQVLAYKRDAISARDVNLVLGTIDDDLLTEVVGLIADSNAAGIFRVAGELLASGKDVRQFLKSLSERVRDMLFLSVGAVPTGPGEVDDTDAVRLQAARFSPTSLMHVLSVLTDAENETRRSNQHRLLLEMALLKLLTLPQTPRAAEVTVLPPIPVLTLVATAPSDTVAPPLVSLDTEDEEALSDLEELEEDDESPEMPSLILTSSEEIDDTEDLLQVQQIAAEAAPPPSLPKVSLVTAAPDAPEELKRLQAAWQEVINRMGARFPSGVPVVKDARPVSLSGSTITLQFANPFPFDRLDKNERARGIVEEIVNKTLDAAPETYKIKCVLKNDKDPGPSAVRPTAKQSVPAETAEPHSPLMDEVIAVFNGRLLDDQN